MALTFLLASPAVMFSQAPPPPTDRATALSRTIDGYFSALVPLGFSGAIGVMQGGAVTLARGYGWADRSRKVSNTERTLFDIGSLSKPLTADAIMGLARAGKLALDDALPTFFEDVPADKRTITIRQLLLHTAGVEEFHDEDGDFESMSRQEAVRRILASELVSTPGQEVNYSSSGYTLLAAIVERVSGQPFRSYLRDEVFRPAQMTTASFYADHRQASAELAHGYLVDDDQGSAVTWQTTPDLWALLGNGGVLASVTDLLAWAQHLGGQLDVAPAEATTDYGLGWNLRDDPARGRLVFHTGANDYGFASVLTMYPARGMVLVMLLNRAPVPGLDIAQTRKQYFAALEALAFGEPRPMPPARVQTGAALLTEVIGEYRDSSAAAVLLEAQSDGVLRAIPRGQTAVDAFLGRDPAAAASRAALSSRASQIAGALVAGNFEPFRLALADPSRFERLQKYLTDSLAAWSMEHGAVRGVNVIGTMPQWWNEGASEPATIIEVNFEQGRAIFRFHWSDAGISAIGGGAIAFGRPVFLVASAARSFTVYPRPDATPISARIERDTEGRLRLTVDWAGGHFEGMRAPDPTAPH